MKVDMIEVMNPTNNKIKQTYAYHSDEVVLNKIEKAHECFQEWKKTPITNRLELLKNLSNLLAERKAQYAKLMTLEMGKPISQSLAEIEKCIWACNFYEVNAEQFLADELIETDANESFVSYDPMGSLLAIMPWNYPFWQVIRFAVPNLTAGNTVILKHAKNVTGCSDALVELFKDAGYPSGCLQNVKIEHEQVELIISDNRIQGVTLTGSEDAGRAIATLAGKYLKKSVLELGGNNACIVWEDADLEKHISTMVNARMQNAGQSCIAAKRFIVLESIYDDFKKAFQIELEGLKAGDPLDEKTEIGVLAKPELVENVQKQIRLSVNEGATVVFGNEINKNFQEPTIVEDVRPGMPLFDEEVFGPIASLIKVKTREESIEMAKNSKFGLGTMLFTNDIEAARKIIGDIPDGAFFINDMVKSDPRLPFGGTKASGYGRELSKEGMLEFVNRKTVYIK
jgi:succinate-semialdehyde dehydrogenase/glutarate-semialdehyde dehydrogenase